MVAHGDPRKQLVSEPTSTLASMETTDEWARIDAAFNRAFADGLRLHRVMRRWSQEDLAERWQVSRPAIAKMETGSRKVGVMDLYMACSIFAVDAPDLLLLGQHDRDAQDYVFKALRMMFPETGQRMTHYF